MALDYGCCCCLCHVWAWADRVWGSDRAARRCCIVRFYVHVRTVGVYHIMYHGCMDDLIASLDGRMLYKNGRHGRKAVNEAYYIQALTPSSMSFHIVSHCFLPSSSSPQSLALEYPLLLTNTSSFFTQFLLSASKILSQYPPTHQTTHQTNDHLRASTSSHV